MKLIAHRGASLQKQENSIESLTYAAQLGAYAVECDIRQTKDEEYVIFHDDNLKRLTGIDAEVSDVTFLEMKDYLARNGYKLLSFNDLAGNYKEKTPVLLHIKLPDINPDFVHMLKNSGLNIICGVQQPEAARLCSSLFPRDRILAFMPSKDDYKEFAQNGAGIIRLWEYWLADIDISDVKAAYGRPEVWIMSCDEKGSMNGSETALNYFKKIGADGVLLNDIVMAINWIKFQ